LRDASLVSGPSSSTWRAHEAAAPNRELTLTAIHAAAANELRRRAFTVLARGGNPPREAQRRPDGDGHARVAVGQLDCCQQATRQYPHHKVRLSYPSVSLSS
jgi:hypothetical protein